MERFALARVLVAAGMAAAVGVTPLPSDANDLTRRFVDMSTRTEFGGSGRETSVGMHDVRRNFGAPRVKSFRKKRTFLRYERPMSFAGNEMLLKVRFPGGRRSLLRMELRF